MVDLVEHLGAEGVLEMALLSHLWAGVAPVELIGLGVSLTLLPLSTVAGLVTLAIGV